jgi:formylglycine-generating enzyme required for sulfatase activity
VTRPLLPSITVSRTLALRLALAFAPLVALAPLAAAGDAARVVRASPLVRIGAGEFAMGSSPDELRAASELCRRSLGTSALAERCEDALFLAETPAHRVSVSAYALDRTEVTQAAYTRCVLAGACAPSRFGEGDPRLAGPGLPVVGVSHAEARAYCAFVGGRLPSEAEWEYAARGRGSRRAFPWGDGWDGRLAHHGRPSTAGRGPGVVYALLAPVGAYPDGASDAGVLDLAGNVSEWVDDWFAPDFYARSPRVDPHGPSNGALRVLRGGSYRALPFALRNAARAAAPEGMREADVGFRCAYALRDDARIDMPETRGYRRPAR